MTIHFCKYFAPITISSAKGGMSVYLLNLAISFILSEVPLSIRHTLLLGVDR